MRAAWWAGTLLAAGSWGMRVHEESFALQGHVASNNEMDSTSGLASAENCSICPSDLTDLCSVDNGCDYLKLDCGDRGTVRKSTQCKVEQCWLNKNNEKHGAGFRVRRGIGQTCHPGCGTNMNDATGACGSPNPGWGSSLETGYWCHNGKYDSGLDEFQDYSEVCKCDSKYQGSECKQIVNPSQNDVCGLGGVYAGLVANPLVEKVEAECFLDFGQVIMGVSLDLSSHRMRASILRQGGKISMLVDLMFRVHLDAYNGCTESLEFNCKFEECTESVGKNNKTLVECTKAGCTNINPPCTGCPSMAECGLGCPYIGGKMLVVFLSSADQNNPVYLELEREDYATGNVRGVLGAGALGANITCNTGYCMPRDQITNCMGKYLCADDCKSDICDGGFLSEKPDPEVTNYTLGATLYGIIVVILMLLAYGPLVWAKVRSARRKRLSAPGVDGNSDAAEAKGEQDSTTKSLERTASVKAAMEAISPPVAVGSLGTTTLPKEGDKETAADLLLEGGGVPSTDTPHEAAQSAASTSPVRFGLAFSNVGYLLKASRTSGVATERQVIQGMTGVIEAGEMCAILGPSGSGKSTMLDILAQRPKKGLVEGSIVPKVPQGAVIPASWTQHLGYVMQDDRIHRTETVYEAIWFAGKMRLNISEEELNDRVWEVLRSLRIDHIAHSRVGSSDTGGISGGERRRVSLGVELVARPAMLALDEVTSGLDAASTSVLVEVLQEICRGGTSVLVSIHQPAASVFMSFDKVLLLARGGHLAYFGPPGDALEHVCGDTIKASKAASQASFNPADAISVGLAQGDALEIEAKWKNTDLSKAQQQMADAAPQDLVTRTIEAQDAKQLYVIQRPSRLKKFVLLCERNNRIIVENPIILYAQTLVSIFVATLSGLLAFQIPRDLMGSQMTIMLFLFYLLFFAMTALSGIGVLVEGMQIYVREKQANFYTPSSYLLSNAICDILPLRVLPAIYFSVIVYWLMGLWPGKADEWGGVPPYSLHNFVFFTIALVLFNTSSITLILFLSTLADSVGTANLISVSVIIYCTVASGAIIISGPAQPIRYSSYFFYAWEVLACTEYQQGTYNFNPSGIPGLENGFKLTATIMLDQFKLEPSRIGMDLLVLLGFTLFFEFCAYLVLKLKAHKR